ncbi:Glycosyltransferase, WcfI-like protein [uncultured delta proteobacterium]|uniref:Glycosyltransferase, WcfI-like protein n=1 Tax=uncultured delta proteobacterium TaxID=34034 RepID=A0A212KH44_9DELT|nr:Glycosyltransferase, WcfI-like protein [uncultured delta proteobacterium]
MNVLHVNTHPSGGGAAVAARRLHKGLREAGVCSSFAFLENHSEEPGLIPLGGSFWGQVYRAFGERLGGKLRNIFYSRPEHPSYSTFSLFPSLLGGAINAIPKDILHLHWVNAGFLSPWDIRRLRGPVVWSLHDAWPFTGGCHYSNCGCLRYAEGCGRCPELSSWTLYDVSRLHWRMKRRAANDLRPVVVAASREHAAKAARSGLFPEDHIRIIPNGVDVAVFRPFPKEQARDILRLPRDRKIILTGAFGAMSDYNKGFDLLRFALDRLGANGENALLAVFGENETDNAMSVPVHFLGRLRDDATLALAYSAADVFVCPSRSESFSLTTLEALACGTPVAAFSVGGIPDMVEHGVSGCLAKPEDPEDLARGIAYILEDEERARNMGAAGRRRVQEEFSLPVIAKRHIALYEEISADSGDTRKGKSL